MTAIRILILLTLFFFHPDFKAFPSGIPEIDSLTIELISAKNDSSRASLHNQIAFNWAPYNVDSSLFHSKLAFDISSKLEHPYLIANSLIIHANALRLKGQSGKSGNQLMEAYRLAEKNGFIDLLSSSCNYLGILSKNNGEYEKAIEYYLQGLELDEQEKDSLSMAIKLMNIGVVYSLVNDLPNSEKYLKQSLRLTEMAGDNTKLAHIYNNLGIIYYKSKRTDSAMFYWWKKAETIYSDLAMNSELANIYGNMAIYYKNNDELKKALSINEQALSLRKSVGNPKRIAFSLISLGEDYARQGIHRQAMKYLFNALSIADSIPDMTLKKNALNEISESYFLNNNFEKAYYYRLLFDNLKDSLLTEENKARMDELNIRYESEKKDRQLLENEILLGENERRVLRQRTVITVSLVISGLLTFLIILLIRNSRQKQFLLSSRLEAVRRERKLDSARFLLEGEERERKRIAKELHDGVNGNLGVIRAMTGKELKDKKNGNGEALEKINHMLDQVSNEVREISHNLMPETLVHLGLDEALRSYTKKISLSETMDINYHSIGNIHKLDEKLNLALFRISQELLINMLKHASATEALVQLSRNENEIVLIIEDNGIGLGTKNQKNTSSGIGLKSIRSRVELLHGKMEIRSSTGEGTSISIDIPLKPQYV